MIPGERIGRHAQLGVRHGVIQIEKERPGIVTRDERRSLFCKQIVHVVVTQIGADSLAVPPEGWPSPHLPITAVR